MAGLSRGWSSLAIDAHPRLWLYVPMSAVKSNDLLVGRLAEVDRSMHAIMWFIPICGSWRDGHLDHRTVIGMFDPKAFAAHDDGEATADVGVPEHGFARCEAETSYQERVLFADDLGLHGYSRTALVRTARATTNGP